MKYLCENVQGCVLGYQQSDEVTLILIDYKKLASAAWFDYEVQKVCSIAASMATMAFNKFFAKNAGYKIKRLQSETLICEDDESTEEFIKRCHAGRNLANVYGEAIESGAMFDARCFNIPKEEVTNLIYWRELDAIRNSMQMVGQANFSPSELQNESCEDIVAMLMNQKGINWNDFPTHQKRGSCCIKSYETWVAIEDNTVTETTVRPKWIIDKEIPIFKGEDRNYIDKLVMVGEE